MMHLFYQNYKQLNGSIDPTDSKIDINEALTLHPFKNHTYVYGMQRYIHNEKIRELQKRTSKLIKDIEIDKQHFT